mmetsp:Transcript_14725/g.46957  ORF Transcript_14725/g.46957 Transcript_14725/m.46957 type:complete len:227 (-) Transcript_14725:129-809(-)
MSNPGHLATGRRAAFRAAFFATICTALHAAPPAAPPAALCAALPLRSSRDSCPLGLDGGRRRSQARPALSAAACCIGCRGHDTGGGNAPGPHGAACPRGTVANAGAGPGPASPPAASRPIAPAAARRRPLAALLPGPALPASHGQPTAVHFTAADGRSGPASRGAIRLRGVLACRATARCIGAGSAPRPTRSRGASTSQAGPVDVKQHRRQGRGRGGRNPRVGAIA